MFDIGKQWTLMLKFFIHNSFYDAPQYHTKAPHVLTKEAHKKLGKLIIISSIKVFTIIGVFWMCIDATWWSFRHSVWDGNRNTS